MTTERPAGLREAGFPYGEFDAHEWASEFDRIYPPEKPRPDIDTMLGWFANAIMTGYDKAKNEPAALAAPVPAADDDRPPLPAETVIRDKAFMEGYLAGKIDYSPGGRFAAPVAVDVERLTLAVHNTSCGFASHSLSPEPEEWPCSVQGNILAAEYARLRDAQLRGDRVVT